MACDIRIASDRAKLGVPFTKLGILPGLGSTHLLPLIVGLGRAQELVLTARVIEAPEALAIGLVNRVVPGETLLTAARETAALLVACDPDALAIAKRSLHLGLGPRHGRGDGERARGKRGAARVQGEAHGLALAARSEERRRSDTSH